MKKISVIVPIYNVEAYVEAGVKSILGQSYTNIEVILIDDGSPDAAGKISDAFAAADSRVRVFHTENRGVSSARNLGISHATGDFVTFVDPDDLIDQDMLQLLFTSLNDNECDVATCELQPFNDGQNIKLDQSTNTSEILSGEKAMQKMFYQDGLSNMPGGKLFKRDLFTDVTFSEGVKIAEDLEVNYHLFIKAKKITCHSVRKYHYRQREGSAMRAAFSPSRMDGLTVTKKLLEDAKSRHTSLIESVKHRLFMEAIYAIIEIPLGDRIYKAEIRDCKSIIKKNSYSVFKDSRTKKKHKAYAAVALISVNLLVLVFKLKRMLRKVQA